MSEWIRIDPSIFPVRKKERIGGVDTQVAVSPHNLPLALKFSLDSDSEVLLIEMKYLDEEAGRLASETDSGFIYVGRTSGRVIKIGLKLQGFSPEKKAKLVSSFEALLKGQVSSSMQISKRQNYSAVEKAIEVNGDRLLACAR